MSERSNQLSQKTGLRTMPAVMGTN